MYEKGDVVLVPFPFTDLTSAKTRPAVVVSLSHYEKETRNIIVAMITSISCTTVYDYKLRDWQSAKLLTASWVRIKLATLDVEVVRYKTGKLSDLDLAEVERRIQATLGLEVV